LFPEEFKIREASGRLKFFAALVHIPEMPAVFIRLQKHLLTLPPRVHETASFYHKIKPRGTDRCAVTMRPVNRSLMTQ
jgi:hypothetical protein